MNAGKAKKAYAVIAALFIFASLASGCEDHSADWETSLPATMTKASVPTVSYLTEDTPESAEVLTFPERETTKRTAFSETDPPLATTTGTASSGEDDETDYSVIEGLPKVPISEYTSSTALQLPDTADSDEDDISGSTGSADSTGSSSEDGENGNGEEQGTNRVSLESGTFRPYSYKFLSEKQLYLYDAIIYAAEQHKDSINISDVMDITPDDYKGVYEVIYNDEPSLFYLSQTMRYTKSASTGKLKSAELLYKYSKSETERMQREIDAEVNRIFSRITSSMSDYDKVKLFYDEIALSVTYDENAPRCHDIYGVFADKKAICGGFSRAFSYLCDKAGIENLTITGDSDGTPHMWNMVKIDGRWYHIDTTYASGQQNGEPYVRYGYFCVTDEMIESCREVYKKGYEYPQAADSSMTYYAKNGLKADSWSEVRRLIRSEIIWGARQKSTVVQFQCSDRDVYDEAVSNLKEQKEEIFRDASSDAVNKINTIEYRPDKTSMVFYIFIEYAQ